MRDVNRLRILQDVIDRNLRPGLAAEMLGITPRHCSRLLKRYRQSGPLGMNNQSRGRTGNRLLSASLTDQALNIIRERYADFGPTLTWEKLAENHGLLVCLNPGTWMKRRHDRSFVRRLKPALIFLIPRISTRAVVQKKLQEKR